MGDIIMKRKTYSKLLRAFVTEVYMSNNNPLDKAWVNNFYRAIRNTHAGHYENAYNAIRRVLSNLK